MIIIRNISYSKVLKIHFILKETILFAGISNKNYLLRTNFFHYVL